MKSNNVGRENGPVRVSNGVLGANVSQEKVRVFLALSSSTTVRRAAVPNGESALQPANGAFPRVLVRENVVPMTYEPP